MVTFLDVAHMVDATAMMGVLGWGWVMMMMMMMMIMMMMTI